MTHEEAKAAGHTHYMIKGGKTYYLKRCEKPNIITHIIAFILRIKPL